MPLFPIKTKPESNGQAFSLGQPEAEAEQAVHSDFNLSKLFVDEMNIFDSLNGTKFIVVGRKGTGKSAIKSYIKLNSRPILKDENADKEIISIEIKPEKILGLFLEAEVPSKRSRILIMCRWCIISAIIKSILDNELAPYAAPIVSLRKLAKKNFDLFDIDRIALYGDSIKTCISLNLLYKDFGPCFSREVTRNDSKPQPFYRFLDEFLKVLEQILNLPVLERYSFVIHFDNLDINFNLYDSEDCEALMTLIREARDFNTNPRIQEHAKVLIYLRDDVQRYLMGRASDTSKVFGSYQLHLNWYEGKNVPISLLKLHSFVNRRLEANFKSRGMQYNHADPWMSYVNDYRNGEMFRNVLDYTFFRPRDLINLFLPVADYKYTLPLSIDNIKRLIRSYSGKVYEEFCDELKVRYDDNTRSKIHEFIRAISNENQQNDLGLDYSVVKSLLPPGLSEKIIDELFEYDVIGYLDHSNDHHFHFRGTYPVKGPKNCKIIFPNIIALYFDRSISIRI